MDSVKGKLLNEFIKEDFERKHDRFIEEAHWRVEEFPEDYEETLEGFMQALTDSWGDYAAAN